MGVRQKSKLTHPPATQVGSSCFESLRRRQTLHMWSHHEHPGMHFKVLNTEMGPILPHQNDMKSLWVQRCCDICTRMNDSSCYLSVQTTEQELELTFDLSLKGDGIMPIKN